MAKQINTSIGGVVKKVSQPYVAVGGVVRKINEGWTSVDGVMKQFYESNFLLYNNGEWGNGYGITTTNVAGGYFSYTDNETSVSQKWSASGSTKKYLISDQYIDLTKYSKLHIKFRVDNYNDSTYGYNQFYADIYIKKSSGSYARAGYITKTTAIVGTVYDVTLTIGTDTSKEQEGEGFYINFMVTGTSTSYTDGAVNFTLYELWLE